MNKKLYRKAVGIILRNSEGKIFTGKRLDTSNAWQMPQGGIDYKESQEKAVMRELHEETNVTTAKIIAKTSKWHYYDLPLETRKKLWKGKFFGQMQKWFLIDFTGDDSEINITKNPQEFSEWKWSTKDDVVKLIVPFKKELYENVFEELKEYF